MGPSGKDKPQNIGDYGSNIMENMKAKYRLKKNRGADSERYLHPWLCLSENQLAIFLSFPRFGYINRKITLSAQTGYFYHLQ